MTAAPGAWPSSRHLLGWWRDLADLGPQRLWVSRLPIHRVEALARIRRRRPLDPLCRALLRFLALPEVRGQRSEARDQRAEGRGQRAEVGSQMGLSASDLRPLTSEPWSALQVDPALLGQLLRGLAGQGMVEDQGGAWRLTAAGRQALEADAALEDFRERRTFAFLDRTAVQQPPHFLPLTTAAPGAPAEPWPFDPAVLEACVRQDAAWKARWRFPADVEAILLPAGGEADPPDWRRVVLDHPEEVTALLVERSPAGLTAFAVQPPGWNLERAAPILELGEGWEEALGDLLAAPTGEQWKQAWQAWCQPRSLPPADAEACRLEAAGHLLRVRAPHRLVERLRAARSDAVKQEAWLLAGAGRTRTAGRIDLVENGPGR